MSVPNQKIIGSINLVKCNGQDKYTMLDRNTMYSAMQDLPTMNALKLWLYLSSNKDGWRMDLSSQDFVNKTGASRSQFAQAFALLVSKGYLVLREGTKVVYDFYQSPSLANSSAASQLTVDDDCLTVSQLIEDEKDDNCFTASQLPTHVNPTTASQIITWTSPEGKEFIF